MVWDIFYVIVGFVLLTVAADRLVLGATGIAKKLGVSPLVIGLTVVAFGTSMPELVVSIQASFENNPGIAVGNVVGSNIFNAALILGIAAMIHPIKCERSVVRRDVPIMIIVALWNWFQARDRLLDRFECFTLFIGIILYTWISYHLAKKEGVAATPEEPGSQENVPATMGRSLFEIAIGLVGLVAGAKLLLFGSVHMAKAFGISDEVIGLTLIAAGTSLPELATSVVAARKGMSEIAIGNVVGSNLFNSLGILGVAGTILPLQVSEHMYGIDMPVMVVVSLGCLPIMRTGYMIVRSEALLLLGAYAWYTYALFQTPN